LESIVLRRPVAIKVKLTEEFRQQIITEATDTINRMETNLRILQEQMAEQLQILQNTDPGQAMAWQRQMDSDSEQLQAVKNDLTTKITELAKADEGEEFPFQTLEGTVSVRIGDNLLEKLTKCELVVKDWKVVEIRNV
jgi:hypothetical protein